MARSGGRSPAIKTMALVSKDPERDIYSSHGKALAATRPRPLIPVSRRDRAESRSPPADVTKDPYRRCAPRVASQAAYSDVSKRGRSEDPLS